MSLILTPHLDQTRYIHSTLVAMNIADMVLNSVSTSVCFSFSTRQLLWTENLLLLQITQDFNQIGYVVLLIDP